MNPYLSGTLPRNRKSRLSFQPVTILQTGPLAALLLNRLLMSVGWFGMSTVKQWSSTLRPISRPPPTEMPLGKRPLLESVKPSQYRAHCPFGALVTYSEEALNFDGVMS